MLNNQVQESFTTPAGTVLPLMNLKGKPYLQVAHRLVWFREERPDWSIITKPIDVNLVEAVYTKQSDGSVDKVVKEKYAIYYTEIKDTAGDTISTGTKMETQGGFADFLEKAETGSIGRALAALGYGTQFAPEFDEGDRIVDSPVTIPTKTAAQTAPIQRTRPVDAIKARPLAVEAQEAFPGAKAV